jgi:hypothetical protein
VLYPPGVSPRRAEFFYQVLKKLVKQNLIGIARAIAALAILTDNSQISPVAVAAYLSAVALAFLAQKVKNKFEHYYNYH